MPTISPPPSPPHHHHHHHQRQQQQQQYGTTQHATERETASVGRAACKQRNLFIRRPGAATVAAWQALYFTDVLFNRTP